MIDSMKQKDQNLLILSYYFPPIKSIGTLRNYQIYRQGRKHFASVKVITTQNRNILQQEPFPVVKKDIHLSPTFDYRTFFRFIRRKKQTHFSETVKTRKVKFLIKLIQSFPFNLLIGEGGLLYTICAFFIGLRMIKRHKITHIYSSYMPYSDHATAWLLKLFHPNLYWIADFRDLHIDPIRQHTLWNGLQRWFNKMILRKADLVTTVSKGLARQLRHFHPRVYMLSNGIAPILLKHQAPHLNEHQNKFTITYTGSVYHSLQDPGSFIQALSEIIADGMMSPDQVRLVYAGKDSLIWNKWIKEAGLTAIFDDQKLVSWPQAIRLQRESHLNLLFTWSANESNGILTGKLSEYLAAGRPILALINGSYDLEFEQLFSRFGAGKVFYTNKSPVEEIKVEIMQQYKNWLQNEQVAYSSTPTLLRSYGWDVQFQKLMDLVLAPVRQELPEEIN